jgi:O-acetyl-ADP-ribose deacetylase (regulator of RNase III)
LVGDQNRPVIEATITDITTLEMDASVNAAHQKLVLGDRGNLSSGLDWV